MIEINKTSWKGFPGILCGLLLGDLLVLTIGMGSPYWSFFSEGNEYGYYGLWQMCSCPHKCVCMSLVQHGAAWVKACQAMVMIGWLVLLAACICALVSTFVNHPAFNKSIQDLAQIALCCVSALFILIGIAVWAAKSKQHDTRNLWQLHWAFGFTIVSLILTVAAAPLAFITMKRGEQSA